MKFSPSFHVAESRFCLALFLMVVSSMSGGCTRTESKPEVTDNAGNELQAREIMSAALEQYSVARTYQDNAVLYLTYRLNGRAIEEPHPWSVAWDRKGIFSADWFNAKIRCDGKRFSCYVFDIESGNIDNQQILIPAEGGVPLDKLFFDSIAAHFVLGNSELPLHNDGRDPVPGNSRLIQPLIGFFDSRFAPDWLQAEQITRLPDDRATGRLCYVLECQRNDRIYRVWIDQELGMFDQIEWPLEFLNSSVLSSQEITDLSFFVRFHDATLNQNIPVQRTEVKQRLAARAVQQFVKLPESMATERLGETVDLAKLVTPAGVPIDPAILAGKTTALLWVAGDQADELVDRFKSLQRRSVNRQFEFGVVYPDEFLENPADGTHSLLSQFRQTFEDASLHLFHDPTMTVGSHLKLRIVPAVVVLNSGGILEFAAAVDTDDWDEQLAVAIQRVSGGESLADEMKSQYQEFIDEYHRQLALFSSETGQTGSAGQPEPVSVAAKGSQVELKWKIDSLQNPGNILVPEGSDRILVVDGWQSVVEIDFSGEIMATHRLNLPGESAINRVRACVDSDGVTRYVAFSMLGKQAFVFDGNWRIVSRYPRLEAELAHGGITECQLINLDDDVLPELLISFLGGNGLKRIELSGDDEEQLFGDPVRSFLRTKNSTWLVGDGALFIDSIEQQQELARWKIDRLVVDPLHADGCLAIAKNEIDEWYLLSLDAGGRITQSRRIGSQYFETEIDSVYVTQPNGRQNRSLVVIACSDDSVSLVKSDRVAAQELKFESKLTGIATGFAENGAFVVTADAENVCFWKTAVGKMEIAPVSSSPDQ